MKKFPDRYEVKKTAGGFLLRFYCDLCNHSTMETSTSQVSQEEAVGRAWANTMRHFNLCHCCGRWVCDTHYNEEEMTCVFCIPKKMYCKHCGKELFVGDGYCTSCAEEI